ncbi:Nicotianamine aminotransferase B [Triticum urartu]|uniref:Nicotianamine aminotransferase B n=1 Tax=Triticum urartu TaxID=4572 RepID=M7ZC26_TRIUA|nr:Nicotianamine aminotransferase B [Triticum urartu]
MALEYTEVRTREEGGWERNGYGHGERAGDRAKDQLEQQVEQRTIGDCISDHLLQHTLLLAYTSPVLTRQNAEDKSCYPPTIRDIGDGRRREEHAVALRGPEPDLGGRRREEHPEGPPPGLSWRVHIVHTADLLCPTLICHVIPLIRFNSMIRAVAEYLSRDLPYMISHDDIFLTCGGSQAIETVMSVFGQAGVNILLPMPGYPKHEAHAVFHRTEVRHYGLLPERGWEVDLEAVEALADGNTVAVVITNPNNPCGSVYTYEHLAKIADMASKLGILVIADEVYGHLVYGTTPFVPMGVFGETVPVITLGAISKRWAVPGWRLGWIATCDPKGILRKTKVADSLRSFISIISGPATFLQGAIPHIIKNTNDEFYNNIVKLLKETAEICYDAIDEIKCITCPHKPEGSFFMMVKLDVSQLSDIRDDVDFCSKLAKEESVILLPGKSLGMENWLRTTFASEPPTLKQGLDRVKSFCRRHQSQAN